MAGSFSSEIDILDQPDGIGSPFAKSTLLHVLIVGGLIGYGYVHNLLHGSEWGSNATQQGAIQATLVSNAALPLPQDHPPTDNVLATENPSLAPELPGTEDRASSPARRDSHSRKTDPRQAAGQAGPGSSAPPHPGETAKQGDFWRGSAGQCAAGHRQQQRQHSPGGNRRGFWVALRLVRRCDQAQGSAGLVPAGGRAEYTRGRHRLCPVYGCERRLSRQRFPGHAQQLSFAQFFLHARRAACRYLRPAPRGLQRKQPERALSLHVSWCKIDYRSNQHSRILV